MFFSSRSWEWSLDNPVHTAFVISVLEDKGIPYRFIPHGESSWGNSLEVTEGYGHIEVPDDFQSEMREIWTDLKNSQITTQEE